MDIATEQGKLSPFLHRLAKTPLLIIDDWGMHSLKNHQYRDFLEILDDRHQTASTLITSQFPMKHWHDTIGNPTLADAILDRIVHNAHKIELKGESMRKIKSSENNQKKEKI